MGVLNVTPDSFSDGMPQRSAAAIAAGLKMAATAPTSSTSVAKAPVPVRSRCRRDVEQDRVVPVIRALASEGLSYLGGHTKCRDDAGGSGGRRQDHQ